MTRRIPQHVREAAICALEWAAIDGDLPWRCGTVADELAPVMSASSLLVNSACAAVWHATLHVGEHADWIEAAALLREGWCPGDPVVRWQS